MHATIPLINAVPKYNGSGSDPELENTSENENTEIDIRARLVYPAALVQLNSLFLCSKLLSSLTFE